MGNGSFQLPYRMGYWHVDKRSSGGLIVLGNGSEIFSVHDHDVADASSLMP